MNDLANLARLIENLIRLGTIAAVQMKPPRVQVKTGTLTTGWLPWVAVEQADLPGRAQRPDPRFAGGRLMQPSANSVARTRPPMASHRLDLPSCCDICGTPDPPASIRPVSGYENAAFNSEGSATGTCLGCASQD